MMQQLRALTERVNAAASRVFDAAFAPLGSVLQGTGMATTGNTTMFANTMFANTAWNAIPSVHATAICTRGKRYERRLQEMLT